MTHRSKIILSLAAALALVFILVALIPPARQAVLSKFSPDPEQEILATAEGDVLNDGSTVKVIKVRNAGGIYVEILKPLENGDSKSIDRIELPDKHDGLFNYQGHVTRLAIADIDNDGKFELLAPSFDNQLVPHLNVFRYNPETNRFELYQPAIR